MASASNSLAACRIRLVSIHRRAAVAVVSTGFLSSAGISKWITGFITGSRDLEFPWISIPFVPDHFSKLGKHLIHVNAAMGNWVLHIREETRVLRLVTWGDQWVALLIAVQPPAKAYKLGPMTLSLNLRNTSSLT